ncbi:MAG: ATP-binding cassette domain-containing protein, partial [Bacteroidales bacterium]|nr:ATP-binding cassette domain-containing protein [Bacteroidales bacterium]
MIQVNKISYNYPAKWKNYSTKDNSVFWNFSLTLEENKIYGLLGKNGVGKSTLLHLLAGLNFPRRGKVLIDGDDITERNPMTMSKIFIVTEEFELPNMSLKKYVKLNRPFYPDFSDEILEKCLNDFEIGDISDLGAISMGT